MKPTAITQRDLIRGLIQRYREQYSGNADSWTFGDGQTPAQVLAKLETLDLETATGDEVAAILNFSWVTNLCNGCERFVPDVVQVGAEPDYKSPTASLCPACLREAVEVAIAAGIIAKGSVAL